MSHIVFVMCIAFTFPNLSIREVHIINYLYVHLKRTKMEINTKNLRLECFSTTTLYVSPNVHFQLNLFYNKYFYISPIKLLQCNIQFKISHIHTSSSGKIFCREYTPHPKQFIYISFFLLLANNNLLDTATPLKISRVTNFDTPVFFLFHIF